ncbi:MAG: M14 family zinc carboxypeptidase, partial [Planctomycetota bacterium]
MELEVVNGYEGSNPQAAENVEHKDDGSVVVRPESEDGDSNYKFAFDVTLRNPGDEPQPLALTVDWQEPPEVGTTYMAERRSIFRIAESTFDEVAGRLDGDRVHFDLQVPPGEVRLCLHPPFWTDELEAFFERVAGLPGARRIGYGLSAEGRALEAAWLPAVDRPGRCVLAIGRIHPYETAGSYFVAGIADLLAGDDGTALRRDTSFVLAPLVNPDGVAHGLCKRTTTGTKLSSQGAASNDPAACALRG